MTESITQLDNIIEVKVGTNTMFHQERGQERLDHEAMARIGREVVELQADGFYVPMVTSGAVTAGMEATGVTERPTGEEALPEIQRLASIGWRHVLNAWYEATGVENGGLLVTQRELNLDTPEHDEALRTTHSLLSHGNIAILNENDGITHGELGHQSFEQNDTLAAIYAAQMAGSDLFGKNIRLVLLSDVDGVCKDVNDPRTLIREIDDLDRYLHLAGGAGSARGKGGMKTKFDAARIARAAGVEMWIANGHEENVIQRALSGEIGTHFTL